MLRNHAAARVVVGCIELAHTTRFRVVHYSIQSNHLHLIVEAVDAPGLACGMKGLVSRIARGLNKLWSRRGSVFPRRFHDVALRSLRQVRNALRYVLNNHLKHGSPVLRDGAAVEPDPYSSARYFDGWVDRPPEFVAGRKDALLAAGGWKLRVGWKRHYRLIAVTEVPGASRGHRGGVAVGVSASSSAPAPWDVGGGDSGGLRGLGETRKRPGMRRKGP